MIGISKIRLKKHENSKRLSFEKEKFVVEEKLPKVASATKFELIETSEELIVKLAKPISLQTADKIMYAFQKNEIIIKEFSWKAYKIGPVRRGELDLVVS